jgi:hypothetical protein
MVQADIQVLADHGQASIMWSFWDDWLQMASGVITFFTKSAVELLSRDEAAY